MIYDTIPQQWMGRALRQQPRPRATRVERADMAKRIRLTAEQRFRAKVQESESGCWMWTGHRNSDGYGSFWNGQRLPDKDGKRGGTITVLAHRWAYEHFIGPIPDGLKVLHTCDQPACVNPACLFVGTQADNIHDCAAKGRRNQARYRKLSPEIHEEIRERYTGKYGQQTALAREYGISQSALASIVGGRKRMRCGLRPGGEPW